LALMMIRSCPRPVSSASRAERSADSIIASIITSRLSIGSGSSAFASIISVSSCWSSEPQLTPMRTGTAFAIATSMIWTNCSSRRFVPTLPGLMRYFASAAAMAGYFVSSRWPL
jgi:hypothetical protein